MLAVPAYSQPVSNAGSRQHHADTATQVQRSESPPILSIKQADIDRLANALETKNTNPNAAADEQNAKDNLKAQQDMAKWAQRMFFVGFAEAVITLLGVALVGFTLAATRHAANAAGDAVRETRRIGEAQVRAYISCESATYAVMDIGVTIWPIFRNTGQSPARNINIEASLTGYVPQRYETDLESGSAPPIPGGQTDNGMITFFFLKPAINAALFKNPDIRVSGVVSWDDVFGKTDTIAFTLLMLEKGILTGRGSRRHWFGKLSALNRTPYNPEDDEFDDDPMLDAAEGEGPAQDEPD